MFVNIRLCNQELKSSKREHKEQLDASKAANVEVVEKHTHLEGEYKKQLELVAKLETRQVQSSKEEAHAAKENAKEKIRYKRRRQEDLAKMIKVVRKAKNAAEESKREHKQQVEE